MPNQSYDHNRPSEDDELGLFKPGVRRENRSYSPHVPYDPDRQTKGQAYPPHVPYNPDQGTARRDYAGREPARTQRTGHAYPPHVPYDPDHSASNQAYPPHKPYDPDHSQGSQAYPPHKPYDPDRKNASASSRRENEPRRRSQDRRPPKKASAAVKLRLFAVLAVLVLVVGGIAFGSWRKQFYTDTVTPGVHVEGIDVSGMTREQVLQSILQYQARLKDQVTVTLQYQSRSWVLTENDFSFSAPTDQLVDAAMAVARTGDVWQRMKDAKEAELNQPNFSGEMDMTDGSLGSRLAEIAQEVNVSAVNATVSFNPDGGSDTFSITDAVEGIALDTDAMAQTIMERLETESAFSLELMMVPVAASVTREDLTSITSRRSFFETQVTGSKNRRSNVELALSKFNGLVVDAGETVSFNKTTGQRTLEAGYLEAAGINKDKGLEDTLGGGVCQASTTLYNAVLMADLDIRERHRHSFPSSYVKTGFDAMVNWPDKDFRFTNNSGSKIYILTDLSKKSDGYYYAQVWIYGKALEGGMTISRDFEEVATTEVPEPEMIQDSSGKYSDYVIYSDEAYIVVPSRAGITVDCYLVYKNAEGAEIKREKIYTDTFAAIKGKHYYGAQVRPEGEKPRRTNTESDDTYLRTADE